MLVKPSLEQLLPKVESRYTLAMVVAKRTRQLVDGAEPMAKADSPNLVTLACEEVYQDQVACVSGHHTPVVPLRPEIEEARRLARELAATQAAMELFPELMDQEARRANVLFDHEMPAEAAAEEAKASLVTEVVAEDEGAEEVEVMTEVEIENEESEEES